MVLRRQRIIQKDIVAKAAKLNLYYIWQDENTDEDSYHAMVVAAENMQEAKSTHPCGDWDRVDMWCHDLETVGVKLVGRANKNVHPGIILASVS